MIEPSHALPAAKVIRLLEVIVSKRGCPEMIRVDNGPEFISKKLESWAQQNNVQIQHIQPGKPAQNGYIERFNRTYREEILSLYLFESIDQVQELTDEWLTHYNESRPHRSLGGLAPRQYASRMMPENSISTRG